MTRLFAAGGFALSTTIAAVSLGACADPSVGEGDADLTECSSTDPATQKALADLPAVADACDDAAPPRLPEARGFRGIWPTAISFTPNLHRGRDSFYAVGEPQWVIGKFAYGTEIDLVGEDVDIYLLRGCAGSWEKLGTTRTTAKGQHPPVEGVDDPGGRVFFEIPADKKLPVGRHRVRMVVAGDNTFADQYIEVLPKGASIFVSDVDGTLTERHANDHAAVCDEESDAPALWRLLIGGAPQPRVHVGAAGVFRKLTAAGSRPFYLTARPEFLVTHTRTFLSQGARADGRGDLPQGIIHTTLGVTGAFNGAAEEFKKGELARLTAKGFKLQVGFGNRPSDIAAYRQQTVPLRFYYENEDTDLRNCTAIGSLPRMPSSGTNVEHGDFRIQSFDEVAAAIGTLAASRACD